MYWATAAHGNKRKYIAVLVPGCVPQEHGSSVSGCMVIADLRISSNHINYRCTIPHTANTQVYSFQVIRSPILMPGSSLPTLSYLQKAHQSPTSIPSRLLKQSGHRFHFVRATPPGDIGTTVALRLYPRQGQLRTRDDGHAHRTRRRGRAGSRRRDERRRASLTHSYNDVHTRTHTRKHEK